jgi:TPR repeat protein
LRRFGMNNGDALKALQEYYDIKNPTPDDEFKFTEALGYLIEETKNPKYMCELGWYYCSKKRFDLEIKYLEMAAEYGYLPAMEELGYMWYYGQHGEKDYDKAFYYFSKGAEGDGTNGNLWCKYKLADMYRFGCSVEKDEDKYREMIEDAYEKVKNPRYLNDPFPEISLRLAGIRADQGKKEEAIELLKKAKKFMAERLSVEAFWGHIEVMGRIIRFLYELQPFDTEEADFYDLFYLTDKPGKYSIKHNGKKVAIEVIDEDGEKAIGYNGKWYRSFEDLCQKAEFGSDKLTTIYDEFYDAEVAG